MKKDDTDIMELNERVENISSDIESINTLIQEYKPFILACTQKVTGRYIRYDEDDELSIALLAFEKAIRKYSKDRGNFLTFAEVLIRNSVIDYLRKKNKDLNVVYLEDYQRYDTEENIIDGQMAVNKYNEEQEIQARKQEIQALKEELAAFDISFSDLEKVSPKSKKTREICNKIIMNVVKSEPLKDMVLRQRQLPLTVLENKTGIKRKKFERHRKYIMAVIVILEGDFGILREYIDEDIRSNCWGLKT